MKNKKNKKESSQPIKVKIQDLRVKHIGKKVHIEGKIIQASEVRPQCTLAKFECPTCGTIISVSQVEKVFREPSKCSCGREGKFKLTSKEMIDAQRIIVAQGKLYYDEDSKSKIPSDKISVFLFEDLCAPEKKIFDSIGKNVEVIGTPKAIPVRLDDGNISVRFDLCIEAESIKVK